MSKITINDIVYNIPYPIMYNGINLEALKNNQSFCPCCKLQFNRDEELIVRPWSNSKTFPCVAVHYACLKEQGSHKVVSSILKEYEEYLEKKKIFDKENLSWK